EQTWQAYQHLFTRFQTKHLTPYFLASLASELSQGRQWTQVSWQLTISYQPWNLIQRVSSEFGLLQMSDQSFQHAKHYCLRRHQPVTIKKWYQLGGCPLNSMKTRASASHSLELAAARLQYFINHQVRLKNIPYSQQNIKDLAAIRHLCGATYGERFIKSQFRLTNIHSCRDRVVADFLKSLATTEITIKKFASAEALRQRQKTVTSHKEPQKTLASQS
ncbi:MAG: hypothetical protein OXC40_07760, partial [Proteobacteria bacterium]|nr:hypothetical protein [Pseudomonadota bacterium]